MPTTKKGAKRSGGRDARALARAKNAARRHAIQRREDNRHVDDFVNCPHCLRSPWGPGRLSNCTQHMRAVKAGRVRSCASRFVEAKLDDTGCGFGLWTLGDEELVLAALCWGKCRRAHRRYATVTAILERGEANEMYEEFAGTHRITDAAALGPIWSIDSLATPRGVSPPIDAAGADLASSAFVDAAKPGLDSGHDWDPAWAAEAEAEVDDREPIAVEYGVSFEPEISEYLVPPASPAKVVATFVDAIDPPGTPVFGSDDDDVDDAAGAVQRLTQSAFDEAFLQSAVSVFFAGMEMGR